MLLPEDKEKLSKLGKYIVELRAKRNLKQYELSDLLDIDVRVIRRIEKGKMNFKIHILFRLAEVLNVSPESLIEISSGKEEQFLNQLSKSGKILNAYNAMLMAEEFVKEKKKK